MSLLVYRLIVVPLTVLSLPVLAIFNRKLRRGLKMRIERRQEPRFSERPIWIHAASGEFEYAKPVIRELKTEFPQIPILVTYFSPTFALNVENFPGVDYAMPLPLDLPGPTSSFLDRFQPRLCLLARTDFWPEILTQTGSRKIPRLVFSYTQKKIGCKALARFRLSLVDEIECVSAEDVAEISRLSKGFQPRVLGDTRYDQVRYRLNHPKALPTQTAPSRACMVAGSTWPEDEEILLKGLQVPLIAKSLQLILVPHEPTSKHLRDLKTKITDLGLTYSLFSSGENWSEKNILLVDRVGVLAELYLLADLAFVGGSFRKTVHSVMEALATGCLTLVGPKHQNNREALEFKNLNIAGRPGLEVVCSAKELENIVLDALANPEDLAVFSEGLREEISRRLGASRRLVESLRGQLTVDLTD